MSGKKQNKANITKSVMKRNWTQLKKIKIHYIIDEMIEKDLISIEKSEEFKEKETRSQQTDALLYEVSDTPQHYLDTFFKILDKNGYDHIVQILQDDADSEAADSHQLSPSHETRRKLSDAVPPQKDTASGGMVTDEMRNEMRREYEEHQLERDEKVMQELMNQMEKQTQILREQAEELSEKQTRILTKQKSEATEKQTQILTAKLESEIQTQFSQSRLKETRLKENETKIKNLESKLKSLQDKLQLERAKATTDLTKKNEKIKNLQKQKQQLQYELDLAEKEYSKSLQKQDKFILKTLMNNCDTINKGNKNLNQEKEDNGEANSSCPEPINTFMRSMPSKKAKQVEGVPKKKN